MCPAESIGVDWIHVLCTVPAGSGAAVCITQAAVRKATCIYAFDADLWAARLREATGVPAGGCDLHGTGVTPPLLDP